MNLCSNYYDACGSDPELLSGQHFGRADTVGELDRGELRLQHLGLVTAEDVQKAGQQGQTDCSDGYGGGHRCACLGVDEPLEQDDARKIQGNADAREHEGVTSRRLWPRRAHVAGVIEAQKQRRGNARQ